MMSTKIEEELNVSPSIDPRQLYLDHIFYPDRFSKDAIIKALSVRFTSVSIIYIYIILQYVYIYIYISYCIYIYMYISYCNVKSLIVLHFLYLNVII